MGEILVLAIQIITLYYLIPFTILRIPLYFRKREDQMANTSIIIRKNFKQHVYSVLKTGNKNGDKKERLDFRIFL